MGIHKKRSRAIVFYVIQAALAAKTSDRYNKFTALPLLLVMLVSRTDSDVWIKVECRFL